MPGKWPEARIPLNLEEAKDHRYGKHKKKKDGYPYDGTRCAAEVPPRRAHMKIWKQCTCSSGQGPFDMFCGFHKKLAQRKIDENNNRR